MQDIVNSGSYRLAPEQARLACSQILQSVGLKQEDAATVVDNLLFADLRGVSSHGISRMKMYTDRARKGHYNVMPNIQVVHDEGSSILIAGDNGVGGVIG